MQDFVLEEITECDLDRAMWTQSRLVRSSSLEGHYCFVKRLQEAGRNNGRVDAVRSTTSREMMAVKRMPDWWVCSNQDEFSQKHPVENEKPWVEVGILAELQKRHFPYSCDLRGLSHSRGLYSVYTSMATEGDMFDWSRRQRQPGPGREEVVKPLAAQVVHAVMLLHELGVSHRDVSLENILLTREGSSGLRVKLIDFSMSGVGRTLPSDGLVAGKRCYSAPEQFGLRRGEAYDAFLADAFSVGVCLWCMATSEYPWYSTKPSTTSMKTACKVGVLAYLESRVLRSGNKAARVMSPELLALAAGLMKLNPEKRWSLGESCFEEHNLPDHQLSPSGVKAPWLPARPSAWGGGWLAPLPPPLPEQGKQRALSACISSWSTAAPSSSESLDSDSRASPLRMQPRRRRRSRALSRNASRGATRSVATVPPSRQRQRLLPWSRAGT